MYCLCFIPLYDNNIFLSDEKLCFGFLVANCVNKLSCDLRLDAHWLKESHDMLSAELWECDLMRVVYQCHSKRKQAADWLKIVNRK